MKISSRPDSCVHRRLSHSQQENKMVNKSEEESDETSLFIKELYVEMTIKY